jgi:glycosyltransferase involved in cell wall biosynthesis
MNNTRLSIIIPTKNEAKYIGGTLEQFVPFLECFQLEVIVSDAHSNDGTAEIVRAYTARYGLRIRLVQAMGKQNIAIGRNYGAHHASGDLLFHTDADVHIPQPEAFFQAIFERFKQSHTVAATAPIWVYPQESGFKDQAYHIFMNNTIRLSFGLGVYLAKGECQIVRRSAFETIGGYNERLVAGEDCNLFYRLHKVGHVAYLRGLCVYHSPRRFRQYGYAQVSWIYLREGLSLLFTGKSFTEEWTPVR